MSFYFFRMSFYFFLLFLTRTVDDALTSVTVRSSDDLISQFDTLGNGTYFHSTSPAAVKPIMTGGFRTDIPNAQAAFHNNRFGRGVYLTDSPVTVTALAERPGGVVLSVQANLGKSLDITSRGPIFDVKMAKAIARGARKHGYDSIITQSVRAPERVNTIIFSPANARATGIVRQ